MRSGEFSVSVSQRTFASKGVRRARAVLAISAIGAIFVGGVMMSGCENRTPAPAGGGNAGGAGGAGSQAKAGKVAIRVSDLSPPTTTPDATYVVRGEVMSLPLKSLPATELKVKHEAIDDFKDREGKVVGMSAMVMEFPPAKGVDVSTLNVGDKVSVTFSVWWTQSPPWLAMKVELLAPETALEFRKKKTN